MSNILFAIVESYILITNINLGTTKYMKVIIISYNY